MKKEKSLNFLSSKWLMIPLFVFGILVFGNTNANAQNSPLQTKLVDMKDLRNSFAPGTAKYDIVQDAIDYLVILNNNLSTNPNYLEELIDLEDADPLQHDLIRRTHTSVLYNYSDAKLAEFEAMQDGFENGTVNPDAETEQKLQWILDANAY